MHKISRILARQILDSRGAPTIEVDIWFECGSYGRASVPSGASVGAMEALESRDKDILWFDGKGVLSAVNIINEFIAESLVGRFFENQVDLDRFLIELDGTSNKSKLGANTTLAISLAFARALGSPLFANILQKKAVSKMPTPMLNLINGGEHAQNALDIQEFMIVPEFDGTITEKMNVAYQIFYKLKGLLKKSGYTTGLGDEGGFAPELSCPEEALDLLSEASLDFGSKVKFALDCAANSFYKDKYYFLEGKKLETCKLLSYYEKLIKSYPIAIIEDPLSEYDIEGWKEITKLLGNQVIVIGDDLFVTNQKLFNKYSEMGIGNGILIKMNQVGTLTETIETVECAKRKGYKIIASHRSGETEDVALAHLAVGIEADYIKAGSICRTDRVCKYNELIRIENEYAVY